MTVRAPEGLRVYRRQRLADHRLQLEGEQLLTLAERWYYRDCRMAATVVRDYCEERGVERVGLGRGHACLTLPSGGCPFVEFRRPWADPSVLGLCYDAWVDGEWWRLTRTAHPVERQIIRTNLCLGVPLPDHLWDRRSEDPLWRSAVGAL